MDLSLDDLAKRANSDSEGTPVRLQAIPATPMRWLRQQKLKQVHETLKTQLTDTTVTQAAIASGFMNLGVFARYYREEFGEKPSQTLHSRLDL